MVLKSFSIAGVALWLAACSATQSIRPMEREPAGFAPWTDAAPVYRLGAGDKVRVEFLLTPEMNQDALVEPDGAIALRIAGRVPAQNLTLAELQETVAYAASVNLRNPQVVVGLAEARAARIIVGGAVERPGVYPLPARASTLEAVMLAGGLTPESRMDEVVIIRQRPDAPPMLRTVDLRRFTASGAAGETIALAPEDIVFVPRSRIAEVNLWIDQYVNRLLPFSRSVSYANTYTTR